MGVDLQRAASKSEFMDLQTTAGTFHRKRSRSEKLEENAMVELKKRLHDAQNGLD